MVISFCFTLIVLVYVVLYCRILLLVFDFVWFCCVLVVCGWRIDLRDADLCGVGFVVTLLMHLSWLVLFTLRMGGLIWLRLALWGFDLAGYNAC